MRLNPVWACLVCSAVLRIGVSWAAEAPVVPPLAARVKVPEDAALAQAEKTVKDIFRAEYAGTARKDKSALATKLMEGARGLKDDAAGLFVMLREARAFASGTGDTTVALDACAEAEQAFDFDAGEWRVSTFQDAVRAGLAAPEAQSAVEAGLETVSRLVRQEKFGVASELLSTLGSLAVRTQDASLQEQIQGRKREVWTARNEYERLLPTFQKLKAQPDDPDANLAVGRYHAQQDQWERALSELAKGKDPAFAAAAQKELGKPEDPAAAAELADLWWSLGGKETPPLSNRLQLHAAGWYRKGLASLTGLKKAVVEKRIAQADEQGQGGAKSHRKLTYKEGLIRAFDVEGKEVLSSTLAEDGCSLVVRTDTGWHMYDLETGQKTRTLKGRLEDTTHFSDDARRAVTVQTEPAGPGGTLVYLDTVTGREIARVNVTQIHTGEYPRSSCIFLPDNRALVALSLTPQVFELPGGKALLKKPENALANWRRSVFSADGRTVFACGVLPATPRAMLTYDLKTGEAGKPFEKPKESIENLMGLAFTDGGKSVFGATWSHAFVWDVTTGALARCWVTNAGLGERAWVNFVCVFSDGRRALTSHWGKGLPCLFRIWDLRAGRLLQEMDAKVPFSQHILLSPDGRFAVLHESGKMNFRLMGLSAK